MTLKGNTADFPLELILRLLTETKKTGELTLSGSMGAGALGLHDGRVVAAVFGDEGPIPALGTVWAMDRADFEFTPWNDPPPANLEGDLQDNLRKADEYKKWMDSVREVVPHDRIRFRLSERAAEQGAVTFTSDRWRVVLAVNGERDVTSLAQHLKVDRDAALNTLAGLMRDGVIETVEPPTESPAPPAPSPPPAQEMTPQPSEPLLTAPPEPAAPPMSEPAAPAPIEPPPASAAPAEKADWTAALLEKRQQQGGEPRAPQAPEWTPPAPRAETPQWRAPAPAAGTEDWTPPAPVEPAPAPTYDTTNDAWTPPAAREETAQWPAAQQGPEWTTPSAEPEAQPPAVESAAPTEAPAWQAPAPAEPAEWTPGVEAAPAEPTPAPPESAPSWTAPVAPPPTGSELDDRLAALEGLFSQPSTTGSAPAQDWSKPASAVPDWAVAQEAAPAAPAADDPRLTALTAPPPVEAAPPAPAEPSEWTPPPPPEPRPTEKKRGGLFGGLFGGGGKREEAAAARPPALTESGSASQVGMLATFSNALLNEYTSGQYGKAKVDDRIPSLLMRVDEQADPIDKPLPVVDDRLDVQALERVGLPESQAVPYLAMLVSTIYADAEKAFGKDKAKRGYKVAQSMVFRGDASALSGLAGKLPKV